MIDWPVAEIDRVTRLRALAAALPHVAFDETVIDAPLERVWGLVGDLETGVPRFERGVDAVDILRRDGDRLEVRVKSALGARVRMDVELRLGWCVMSSRITQVGMAATALDDGRTRFAHFEGSPLFGAILKPIFRWNIAGDFERIAELTKG